jgi:hypothetical protein
VIPRAQSRIRNALLAFGLACVGAALVRAADADEPKDPPELAAIDIPIANAAYEQFKKQYADVECYVATIEREGENLTVSFSPKDNVQDLGDALLINASKCRQGVTYVLDRKSEIIKKAYHR